MHKSFRLALGKLNALRKEQGRPPLAVRPYDLRHSFATWLAHRITDERALQEMLMHSRPEQSRRYTEQATAGRLDRALAALTGAKAPPIVARKVATRRKSAKSLSV